MVKLHLVYNNAAKHKIDYIADKEYLNDTLEYIHHGQGRLIKHNATWQYEYSIKDHLDNRAISFAKREQSHKKWLCSEGTATNWIAASTMMFSDITGNGIISNNERRSRVDYYTFGMEHYNNYTSTEYSISKNNYKYNGKEVLEEMNIGLQNYGARLFNNQIGRWHQIDPYSHKYPAINPYNFVANNPTIYVDPDGKDFILYLVFQPGQKQTNEIVNEAQKILNDNGINLKVMGLTFDKGKFLKDGKSMIAADFYTKLDQTDGLAIIGDSEFINSLVGGELDGGQNIHQIGYIDRNDIDSRSERQGVDKTKALARTAIHEGVGHRFLGIGHSSFEGQSIPRYNNGTMYSTEVMNIMHFGGDIVKLNDPNAYKFLIEDKNIIQLKVPLISKKEVIPFFYKYSINQPTDNFTKKL